MSPFSDTRLAGPLAVPCKNCGRVACSLELPKLDERSAMFLRPILRLALNRAGIQVAELPDNPLEGIPPAAVSEILAVTCASCASSPRLLAIAAG
jgi:hypothetical protein